MGKKARLKRESALLNAKHPAHAKHRALRAWAKLYAQRHHGVFVERQNARRAVIIDGKATMAMQSVPAIHGLSEYNKHMQSIGFGTPSLHYAHRLIWQGGRVVGFKHRIKPNHERRILTRTLPRGKAALAIINREKETV